MNILFTILFLLLSLTNTNAQTVTANRAKNGANPYPQLFFGTAAPGSVTGNLPGDEFSDTTNHNFYKCNATSATTAPACTSVTAAGWIQINGAGGSSIVQQAIVNITSAQIKTLNASPITIVAAQGAGTFIEFLSATVEYVCSGCTQYTAGSNLTFAWTGGVYAATAIGNTNFNGLTATSILTFPNAYGAGVLGLGNLTNLALTFSNPSGPEFATGTGTLIVQCQYIVHTGL